jgi:hypothetical protein
MTQVGEAKTGPEYSQIFYFHGPLTSLLLVVANPSGSRTPGKRPVVGSLRQSRLAQALSETEAVLCPPVRRRYPVKIAKPQRGIDLAQAGNRRSRFDHPV